MSAIPFVVRDAVGNIQQGAVIDSSDSQTIHMPQASQISLDMRRLDVAGYIRSGNDLVLMLGDGRKVVLEDYYGPDGNPQSTLYLNEGGHLIETNVSATGSVVHTEADAWGKYSDLDALSYPDDPVVTRDGTMENTMVAGAYTGDEDVTMGPGLAAIPLMGLAGGGGSAAPEAVAAWGPRVAAEAVGRPRPA